jgi:hypothetical protein
LPFALLSDSDFRLLEALRLPTFEIAGMRLLKRLTMMISEHRIDWSAYLLQGEFSSSQLLPNHVCSLGKQKMGASPTRLRLNGFFRF